jgi:pectate lyase-like protein
MKPQALLHITALLTLASLSATANAASPPRRGHYGVVEFGAHADGKTDDTEAFQKALNAAAAGGGGVVHVPTGNFLMMGHLDVPPNVTLEGIWHAPPRGAVDLENGMGTTLLAVEGKGVADGTPFISLHTSSTLEGVTIFYPEQVKENPPHPYPWTVRTEGDNCSVLNVLIVNPYQALDMGTKFTGRHYVNGLYAQALYRGLFIDQCYDVGRIENVHFWPFWEPLTKGPLFDFTLENGVAYTIARTDGQFATNCFCIFYGTGFHFVDAGHGGGSGAYTNCYSDVTPCAVKVDAVQTHSGVSFVNGMFMATVEVGPENAGPVMFTGCGFWGWDKKTTRHAKLEGTGHTTFSSCHFSMAGFEKTGEEAVYVDANGDGLTVTGCDFVTEGSVHVRLGGKVNAAIVTGNRFRGGEKVENESNGDVQMGLNAGR